jgi:hypothetical protein
VTERKSERERKIENMKREKERIREKKAAVFI